MELLFDVVSKLLTILSLACAVYFGIKSNRKSDNQDVVEKVARDTRIEMTVSEIDCNVKEIKETLRNIQNDVKDHEGRIVKLEASFKAGHKRIDEINEIVEEMRKSE